MNTGYKPYQSLNPTSNDQGTDPAQRSRYLASMGIDEWRLRSHHRHQAITKPRAITVILSQKPNDTISTQLFDNILRIVDSATPIILDNPMHAAHLFKFQSSDPVLVFGEDAKERVLQIAPHLSLLACPSLNQLIQQPSLKKALWKTLCDMDAYHE